MAFPIAGGPRNYLVEGCLGRTATRMAMQVHFSQRNVWDTLFILEEGNLPYPWCPHWKILAPWCDLNGRHLSTAQCARGADRKQRRLAEE